MNELPELSLDRILSFLSLRDLLKMRTVSRAWYHRISCRQVKSFCCSQLPSGFVFGKGRWITGAFAHNFISSPKLHLFLDTFGSTTLSNLKHLRLCDARFNIEYVPALVHTLNSFDQLEVLDIIVLKFYPYSSPKIDVELKLPMLRSIHLEAVYGVGKLTLDSSRLQQVEHLARLSLALVHGESVERLLLNGLAVTEVEKLKNLQCMYVEYFEFDSMSLSSLEQLTELHLHDGTDSSQIPAIFEQKRQYGRTDLKIYFCGLLLNGPDDPLISLCLFEDYDEEEFLMHLAENPTRLADEIPFFKYLNYLKIERVAPELAINLVGRFTELYHIYLAEPVQDVQRFLNLLKSLQHIEVLSIECNQPQDLFDRLSDHCVIQLLAIYEVPSDHQFLFRLEHLLYLYLKFSIDLDSIRKVLELPLFSSLTFLHDNEEFLIEIDHLKRFKVSVAKERIKETTDLNDAIQFIAENMAEKIEKS